MDNSQSIINPSCPWQPMENYFGTANVKWCEERLCALINEPANTWSNLLYLFIGAFLIYQGYKSKKTQLGQFQFFFGCVVYIMGVGSFVYHATNNYLTQIFDFIGMFLYIYMLICLSLYNLNKINPKQGFILFTSLVIGSTILIPISKAIGIPYQYMIIFGAFAIITLQLKTWHISKATYPKKDLAICLLFFIVAATFSYMDVSRIWCNPANHFIQGHALWHILNAIGVWFSYLMFKKQLRTS